MKMYQQNHFNNILPTISFLLLAACSSGSSTSSFKVSGTVTGLSSNGLMLQNNGADDLAVAGTTFEFATALANGATYNVAVDVQPLSQSCDVSNGSGIVNGGAVTDVKVSCRGWRTAEFIENNADDASDAQIAMATNGNAIVVWRQARKVDIITLYSVSVNYYTAGSGWGVAEELFTPSSNAKRPQIAINSSGNAITVWYEFNEVLASQYVAGGSWEMTSVISDGTGNVLNPQIAIDDSGNALAVWSQDDGSGFGGNWDIYANRYTADSGWGDPEIIETDDMVQVSQVPQIAINSSGQALAVWWSQSFDIRSNRYTPDSGWGVAETIVTDDGSAGAPQVAINDAGDAVAVWRQSDVNRAIVWANNYTAETGWGTAVKIDLDDAKDADIPQVGIDDSGNAVVVWRQNDGLQFNIYSNRYTTDNGWGSAELIENINVVDNPKAGSARKPQIAVDNIGNALAVWELDAGGPVSIYANRYIAGSGWGSAELIEIDDAGMAWNPQIAVSVNGNGVAVWQQFDGTYVDIKANRFE